MGAARPLHDPVQVLIHTAAVTLRLARKSDVLQCDCGGRRSLVAVIDQPPVVTKILAHLWLATEALTKPEVPVWLPKMSTLRGLPVELDSVAKEPCVPSFEGLLTAEGAT